VLLPESPLPVFNTLSELLQGFLRLAFSPEFDPPPVELYPLETIPLIGRLVPPSIPWNEKNQGT
jgi:hypothetical protein